ncbi:MAG: V-type ATP synthase subunit I [Atribacteria bacterium 34_128]|nr:MAG: V-type ATP synthase subunit I [Atribacteria bacterium 34_128]
MSVEKMKIMGIIGPKNILNKVLRVVILNGSMHMINALSRVNSADFFLPPTEKNITALEEIPFLKPYSQKRDLAEDEKMVNLFQELFDIKPCLKREYLSADYNYDDFMKQFSDLYNQVLATTFEIEEKSREIDKKREYLNNLKYLTRFNLDISRLMNMKYLVFRLIKITRENYEKLKKNYENIPAIILKLAVEGKYVVLASVTPGTLEETLEKIFSSLNYLILPIPRDLKGTVDEVTEQLTKSIAQEQVLIAAQKKSLADYKEKYIAELQKMYSRLEMEKKIEEVKSEIALGNHLFFLFGFVPVSSVFQLKEELERQFDDELIILIDDIKEFYSGITPPSKLNNIKLFKPFESLVKMYGIPSYQEKDPTVFFGLTYLIFFGAMFGDVGQGFVLLLGGLILEFLYHKIDFGGILSRLGLSSIIFGFLYGSVFGSEEILPALLIRPMSNIDSMLMAAVVFGIILLLGSYIFSIFNAESEKNIKEAFLGKNGLVGLIFYILLLYTIAQAFLIPGNKNLLPILIIVLAGLLLIILFKEPIAKRLFPSAKSARTLSANDYIEEGFGILEMLLSIFSNTISFLRVGAFALNHVGLYIAFLTLSRMISSSWGSWAVLILGNIIILTLEALIVFIQALRLEYYELFTKFYRGDGIEYSPVKINGIASPEEKRSLEQKRIKIAFSCIS